MILQLLQLLPASLPHGRRLRANIFGLVLESVLMGVGFALLVPLLRATFDGDYDIAWPGDCSNGWATRSRSCRWVGSTRRGSAVWDD